MHLARNGTASTFVPAIYDWQSSVHRHDADLGWILMGFKRGVAMDQHFASLSDSQKEHVLDQIADIFSFIQRVPLPDNVKSYGGLTICGDGGIVSGQMTTLEGGPWPTYVSLIRAKLASQLQGSNGSSVL